MKLQFFYFFFLILFCVRAQVFTFQSEQNGKTITHRILMDKNYLVETQYLSEPAEFILTRGGFYKKQGK